MTLNKKGQTSKILFWLVIGIIFSGLILGLGAIIAGHINSVITIPPQLRAELITLRFVNLPECFAPFDSTTGIVQSGVIDFEKFTEENLNRCYHSLEAGGFKTFNFRLVLASDSTTITTDKYYHHDSFTLFKEVLVERNHELVKDQLIIYVQEEI